jgi:hypothetical protein
MGVCPAKAQFTSTKNCLLQRRRLERYQAPFTVTTGPRGQHAIVQFFVDTFDLHIRGHLSGQQRGVGAEAEHAGTGPIDRQIDDPACRHFGEVGGFIVNRAGRMAEQKPEIQQRIKCDRIVREHCRATALFRRQHGSFQGTCHRSAKIDRQIVPTPLEAGGMPHRGGHVEHIDIEIGHPAQEGLDHHLNFHPCKMHPDAEMHAVPKG